MDTLVLSSPLARTRPKEKLETHLRNTFRIASHLYGSKQDPPAHIKIATLLHDLGKSTDIFQRKLMKNTHEAYRHEYLSALVAYMCALDEGTSLPPELIASAVLAHHKIPFTLNNLGINKKNWKQVCRGRRSYNIGSTTVKQEIEDLITKLEERKINFLDTTEKIYKDLGLDISGYINPTSLREALKKWKKSVITKYNKDNKNWYIPGLELYSILVEADMLDSTFVDTATVRKYVSVSNSLTYKLVNKAIKSASEQDNSPMKAYRLAANEYVNSELDNISRKVRNGKRIIRVELPTGAGKTLLNLLLSTKLREDLKLNGRVVYTLPFLSIIDQTTEVIKKVVGVDNASNKSLLRFDHLYKEYNSEEITSASIGLFLASGWYSDVIITTFNQLVNTIFPHGEKQNARRLWTLKDAIVILDEIQSIPPKYWASLETVIKQVADKLGTIFIVSTATHPPLFEDSIKLSSQHLPRIRRRKYILSELTNTDQIIDKVKKIRNKYKSIAIVVNKVKRSQEIFQKIRESNEFSGWDVFNLTSYMYPVHREKKISQIKKAIKSGRRVILVSTQVIEAGVDISFDYIIRDIAPLDSIIQSGGRCNRHFENKEGIVEISKLQESDKLDVSIYDTVLWQESLSLLERLKEFDENNTPNILSEYYQMVLEKKRTDALWEDVSSLKYICTDMKLINEKGNKSTVVVLTKDSKAIIEDIRRHLQDLSTSDDKARFDILARLQKKFSELSRYAISIYKDRLVTSGNDPILDKLGVSSLDESDYNNDVGIWITNVM